MGMINMTDQEITEALAFECDGQEIMATGFSPLTNYNHLFACMESMLHLGHRFRFVFEKDGCEIDFHTPDGKYGQFRNWEHDQTSRAIALTLIESARRHKNVSPLNIS